MLRAQDGVELGDAYRLFAERAGTANQDLTAFAALVLDRAAKGQRWDDATRV